MKLAECTVRITKHGHEQYCERVQVVSKTDLQAVLQEKLAAGEYNRTDEYIKLEGVWWVFEVRVDVMIMITCYGRTFIDIPKALRWARHNKDRIVLTGGEVLCDEADGEAEEVC
ncbi:hypothetical protein [Paenibacillus gorillae]|uniref:hypothetical protein n=1 Tax=Paenibacillus gorillae TaxID=1243662 RepID=UPI0012DCCE62|nr:hypothetical protein [Paenibacillus gorillae]